MTLYQNPGTIVLLKKAGFVFIRIRAYLRYIKSEGGKPRVLYQDLRIMGINLGSLGGYFKVTLGI